MVAFFFLGKKNKTDIIHHKDGNWYNNDPSNIEYKDKKLHSRDHRKSNPIFSREGFQRRRRAALKARGFYAPELYEKKRRVACENLSVYNNSSQKKENDKLAGLRGAKFLVAYNKSEKGREKSSENGKRYGFGKNNHKVLFTRRLSKKEDVYCLTVEKYNNFALAAGVFVHNCGMDAIQTSLREDDLPKDLHKLRLRIEALIPCGTGMSHGGYHPATKENRFTELWDRIEQAEKGNCTLEKAKSQMGTLGSGNHFIEVCVDTAGWVWLMLHSGSRNFGKEVADTHAKKAKLLPHNTSIPHALSVFLRGTPEFDAYWRDMQTAQIYAKLNRQLMMEILHVALCEEVYEASLLPPYISCHHNYATEEEHFGEKLIVARKGAIEARLGQKGIIPGARGRKSFIVEGLGNPESLFSASHGAGRRMSRGDAKRRYTLEDVTRSSQGIECYVGKGVVDEIAEAYKNIEKVMQNQIDLVKPIVELRAIINIKGHDDRTKQDRKASEKSWKQARKVERELRSQKD